MRRSQKPIVIASRQSPLAKVQAEMVGRGLARLHPKLQVQYVWVTSEGDRVTTGPLAEHGGKGLFTKAVERVVLSGEADIAVHSMKDMPADEAEAAGSGLQIAAVPKRADVRDALLGKDGPMRIDELKAGMTVGTTSPRRGAQMQRLVPGLRVVEMRGNVGTRLSKVKGDSSMNIEPTAHCTLLAVAGLSRLGMTDLITQPIEVDTLLPAAAQGALGIQCRRDDHISLTRLLPLNDPSASTAVHAERDIVAGLGADCHSAVAVLVEPVDPQSTRAARNADSHWFRIRAKVWSHDGSQEAAVDQKCKTRELRRIVRQVVESLNEQGAGEMLASARG